MIANGAPSAPRHPGTASAPPGGVPAPARSQRYVSDLADSGCTAGNSARHPLCGWAELCARDARGSALRHTDGVGVFDWLRRARRPPPDPGAWDVRREGWDVVVVAEGREYRFAPGATRSIRVVPMGAGAGHGTPHGGSGWQVAAARDDGDVLLGPPVPDGRAALAFALRLSEVAGVAVDELSARLFSQVGRFAEGRDGAR